MLHALETKQRIRSTVKFSFGGYFGDYNEFIFFRLENQGVANISKVNGLRIRVCSRACMFTSIILIRNRYADV